MIFFMDIVTEDHPLLIDLYDRKKELYFNYAIGRLEDPYAAEEIVQDAFVDFIMQFHNIRHITLDEMERYIMGIVKHKCVDRRRSSTKVFSLDELDDIPDAEQCIFTEMEEQCDRETACKVLHRISEQAALQLVLFYYYHFSDAVIAGITHTSPKSVPKLRQRAKQSVRKALLSLEGQS